DRTDAHAMGRPSADCPRGYRDRMSSHRIGLSAGTPRACDALWRQDRRRRSDAPLLRFIRHASRLSDCDHPAAVGSQSSPVKRGRRAPPSGGERGARGGKTGPPPHCGPPPPASRGRLIITNQPTPPPPPRPPPLCPPPP